MKTEKRKGERFDEKLKGRRGMMNWYNRLTMLANPGRKLYFWQKQTD